MEDMDIVTEKSDNVTEIYFTLEVLQALGVEGEVVLHYGVFDFSVQLYKFFDGTVSVMLEAGEFFQKMVSSREEKAISLCVQMYNKTFAKQKSSVNFNGLLKSVQQHEFKEADTIRTFIEIHIVLDEEALLVAKNVLEPLLQAVETYHEDEQLSFLMKDKEVQKGLIALPYSTLHLNDGSMMRSLPHRFGKESISILLQKDRVDVEQEVELSMVLLTHQVNIALKGRIVEKKALFPLVEEVVVTFIQRPPLAYLLFLSKIKYYHKNG